MRVVIVLSVMNPYALEVFMNRTNQVGRHPAGMKIDCLEKLFDLEGISVILRVKDVVSRYSGTVEIVCKHFPVGGKVFEAGRIDAKDKNFPAAGAKSFELSDFAGGLRLAPADGVAVCHVLAIVNSCPPPSELCSPRVSGLRSTRNTFGTRILEPFQASLRIPTRVMSIRFAVAPPKSRASNRLGLDSSTQFRVILVCSKSAHAHTGS